MTGVAVRGAFCAILIMFVSLTSLKADDARVVLEVGRDYAETRFFDACHVRLGSAAAPLLAVAGFSQTGQGDVGVPQRARGVR